MDRLTIIKRLLEFNDEEEKTTQEPVKTQKYPRKNELFDLDKIPKEVLDRGWKDYGRYYFNIDHRNPFANRVMESTDYKEHTRKVLQALRDTFPISKEQIENTDKDDFSKLDFNMEPGHHGMFAILVSGIRKNPQIIEELMESKGFFRSRPTDKQMNEYEILEDPEGRPWYVMRFEPIDPDDVTDEVHEKYDVVYHLTPSVREKDILENGLVVSNRNPKYRYNEPRVYFMEGDSEPEDFQELTNTLYAQALKDDTIPGKKTPIYTLFTFDVTKMGEDIRFFYDINEPKGLYVRQNISPKFIKEYRQIRAQTKNKNRIPNHKDRLSKK